MNTLVAFAAVALGIGVWLLLLQRLTAKPWLERGAAMQAGTLVALSPATIGLAVFLAVVTSLFGLMASAYFMRMMLPDWTHIALPPALWLNTAILVLASCAMQLAWSAADRGAEAVMRRALLAGGMLALLFLIGQIQVWRQLHANGFYLACGPGATFFYLFTALHGAHLAGGLGVLGATAVAARRVSPEQTALRVKLCAAYWHYLLVLWLAIFALLSLT